MIGREHSHQTFKSSRYDLSCVPLDGTRFFDLKPRPSRSRLALFIVLILSSSMKVLKEPSRTVSSYLHIYLTHPQVTRLIYA
jgi:hypothetical protein